MKPITQLKTSKIRVVLTDIDGTITEHGRLPAMSYASLEALNTAGLHVVPVTGRPAGWCELIARLWPVHGVVGENGAFAFRYDGKLRRHFARNPRERREDRRKLRAIRADVMREVPGAGVASDQFCRLFDLAIDFSEDVPPLKQKDISKIVEIFHRHGAQAKVSNIHVNGWFGAHDKVSTCRAYLKREFKMSDEDMRRECLFIGDSPNDEPMFEFFPHAVAVANIREFAPRMKHLPAYVTKGEESKGFAEMAKHLLSLIS